MREVAGGCRLLRAASDGGQRPEAVLARSLAIGRHRFPTRADYANYLIEALGAKSADDVWRDATAAISIQNHWLTLGQSGCLFAQRLLRDGRGTGWCTVVLFPDVIGWDACGQRLNEVIDEHIAAPDCELLSLLFPVVETDEDFVQLIHTCARLKRAVLLPVQRVGRRAAVSIRINLNAKVESWALGFGPYAFLPLTRQAPITELVVRVKPQKSRHCRAPIVGDAPAHVADMPFDHHSIQVDRLWVASVRRTKHILGSDDRTLSRARVTLAVPAQLIERVLNADNTKQETSKSQPHVAGH